MNFVNAPELIYRNESSRLIDYRRGLKMLDSQSPDAIVMVCNTIHLYREQFQKYLRSPIVDLVGRIEHTLRNKRAQSVAVLGTLATASQDLYSFEGIEKIQISKPEQREIADAIFEYNAGRDQHRQREVLAKIIDKKRQDVDKIILGCTELCAMFSDYDEKLVNTLDELVEATMYFITL